MYLAPDRVIESRNAYLEFLTHLNATGVRYAVLHGWESLRENNVSDLDIVIEACDLSLFETSLYDQYRILSMLHYEATGFAFVLLSKASDTFSPFNVDVITDYRWRGRIFFNSAQLLENHYQWQNLWVVGREEEFTYLLIRKIYEKGRIPERQGARLQLLARQLGPDASRAVRKYFGQLYGEQLAQLILNGDTHEIERRIQQFRNALRRETLKRGVSNPVRYWLAEMRRLWGRFCHPTGLSIGISGASPQESEMIVSLILKHFSRVFRRAAVYSSLSRLSENIQVGSADSGSLYRIIWPLKRFLRALHYTLDYWRTVHALLVRSSLVVLNDYATDACRLKNSVFLRPEVLLSFDGKTWHLRSLRDTSAWPSDKPGTDAEVFWKSIAGNSSESGVVRELSRYLARRYKARRDIWFRHSPLYI